MSPEERQLITGMFDRMRPAANQQRDREAESLIGEQVRNQPYAPYLLAQTVIVQDQALQAANAKILELEDAARKQTATSQPEETSFLGGIGRSIFGSPQPEQSRASVPTTGGQVYPHPQSAGGPWAQQPAPQAAAAPWGQQPQQGGGMFGGMGGGGGGGFLKGALGAAAGVAGGVLVADGIRNLFSGGNNPYGIASGFGGGEGANRPVEETTVNNYYDSPNDQQDTGSNDQVADAGDFDPGSYGGYSNDA